MQQRIYLRSHVFCNFKHRRKRADHKPWNVCSFSLSPRQLAVFKLLLSSQWMQHICKKIKERKKFTACLWSSETNLHDDLLLFWEEQTFSSRTELMEYFWKYWPGEKTSRTFFQCDNGWWMMAQRSSLVYKIHLTWRVNCDYQLGWILEGIEGSDNKPLKKIWMREKRETKAVLTHFLCFWGICL